MKKNFLLLTVALLCAVVQGAWAESVTFNVRSWDATTKQVVTTATTKDCTVLTGSHSDDWLGLGGGDDQDYYYVAKGNVSYLTLNCFGRVHLILADGATLTCTGGLKVEEDNNNAHLFIYSQSNGDQEGKLIVTNSYEETAGIGSSISKHSGTIEIHGGNLDVTGGKYGAGIGAGKCYGSMATKAGTISVFGGTIKAQGGLRGAGIGGGAGGQSSDGEDSFSDGANFFLYGGTVTATGGELAAGVGGGGGVSKDNWLPDITANGGGGGKCHIYGGNLTAQGGRRGAGIGGGNKYESGWVHRINDGEVNIEGGTVTATGGDYGAGIGGGCNCTGGTVNISGGNITAKGGTDGAGIGGGESGWCQAVTISGGYVRAEGTSYGAGIGGGEDAHGGTVTITGGTVIAIAGGDCTGSDDKGGSAIGCGQGVKSKDASENRGSLSIPDDYMVTGGDAEDNIERVFTTVEREGACIWRNYVKIEPCQHTTPTVGSDQKEAVSYTSDNETHTKHCRYCAYTLQENHAYAENICTSCGKNQNENDDMWSVTMLRASAAGSTSYADRVVMKVVKGQTFTIPAVSATEGLTLMGYTTSWNDGDGIEMKDGETLTTAGAVVTPTSDMNYYSRYRYRYVPTWTWDEATATATLTITCSALSSEAVTVSNITYNTDGEVKTATGTYSHNGATYTFTDTYLLPVSSLALQDNASNDETLESYWGRRVNTLMLSGRTLYADGSWNTLCLPFSISAEDIYTNLGSCTLKTLSSSEYNSTTGTLTLNFIDATSIEAGKPYLIMWASGSGNRTNPSFTGVTISDILAPVETDYVDFVGFFSPVSLTGGDKSVLYLGADNTLYYPSTDMTVGSCRAVFRLKDITAGDLPQQARRFVLNFGDGDETTGIISIDNGQLIIDNSMDAWYSLDGRRLTGKPSRAGVYINNGKKIVIK
jgi:hypothetical protein